MFLSKVQKTFFVIAMGLMGVGIVLFTIFPAPMLWDTYVYKNNISNECVVELGDCSKYGNYNYTLRDNKGTLETIISGGFRFYTSEVFSTDNPVSYSLVLADNPKFVKHILLLIDFDNKNNFNTLENMTFSDIQPSISTDASIINPKVPYGKSFHAIPLYNVGSNQYFNYNSTEFTGIGNFTITPMFVDDKNIVHIGSRYDPILELKDIRYKQLADENIQAKIDSKTNLALAWVVVALAPMVVSADFFGRVFLTD